MSMKKNEMHCFQTGENLRASFYSHAEVRMEARPGDIPGGSLDFFGDIT